MVGCMHKVEFREIDVQLTLFLNIYRIYPII
ncbi:MAG: hypothetical protein RLZ36_1143 [Pseudomonadota bacterium]|jgi:hypothetical protein